MAAARRLVAQLAVALARDLARVHHQTAGDGVIRADRGRPVSGTARREGLRRTLRSCSGFAKRLDRQAPTLVPAAVFILEDTGKLGGIVVAKTLAKLTFGIAALAAATWFGISISRAYGDAPWCAVKTLSGDVYWNCQYRTIGECAPNVVAGDRGFCALNPWPGPSQVVPYKYQYQKRYAR